MERKILNIKEILKSTNYKRNCFLFSIFFFAGILACTVCLTSGLSYEITWESILGTSIFTLVFGFLFTKLAHNVDALFVILVFVVVLDFDALNDDFCRMSFKYIMTAIFTSLLRLDYN